MRNNVDSIPATTTMVRSLAEWRRGHWPRGIALYQQVIRDYFLVLARRWRDYWATELAEDLAQQFLVGAIDDSVDRTGSNDPNPSCGETSGNEDRVQQPRKSPEAPRIVAVASAFIAKHAESLAAGGPAPESWHGYLLASAKNFLVDGFRRQMQRRRFELPMQGDMIDRTGDWAVLDSMQDEGAPPEAELAQQALTVGELPSLRPYTRLVLRSLKPGGSRKRYRNALMLRVLVERVYVPAALFTFGSWSHTEPRTPDADPDTQPPGRKEASEERIRRWQGVMRARAEKYGSTHEYLARRFVRPENQRRKASRKRAGNSAVTQEELDQVRTWLRYGVNHYMDAVVDVIGEAGVREFVSSARLLLASTPEFKLSASASDALRRNPSKALRHNIKHCKAALLRMLAGQAFDAQDDGASRAR